MYSDVASWFAYILALLKEMGAYLFVPGSGNIEWQMIDNEWQLVSANMPELSAQGKDIVHFLMTILHNLLINFAQDSASLPSNILQP